MKSRKRSSLIPAIAAVVALPLLACGSAPSEESTSSTGEALIKGPITLLWCAPGAQTYYGVWVPGGGTIGESLTWFATGAPDYTDPLTGVVYASYAAVDVATGQVEEDLYVAASDQATFASENAVCIPVSFIDHSDTGAPPTNGNPPRCHKLPSTEPSVCMDNSALGAIESSPYYLCGTFELTTPAQTTCPIEIME